jgi:hypothetical protein
LIRRVKEGLAEFKFHKKFSFVTLNHGLTEDRLVSGSRSAIKSLSISPAYRRAGFDKGRNYPSLRKRGEGRFTRKEKP